MRTSWLLLPCFALFLSVLNGCIAYRTLRSTYFNQNPPAPQLDPHEKHHIMNVYERSIQQLGRRLMTAAQQGLSYDSRSNVFVTPSGTGFLLTYVLLDYQAGGSTRRQLCDLLKNPICCDNGPNVQSPLARRYLLDQLLKRARIGVTVLPYPESTANRSSYCLKERADVASDSDHRLPERGFWLSETSMNELEFVRAAIDRNPPVGFESKRPLLPASVVQFAPARHWLHPLVTLSKRMPFHLWNSDVDPSRATKNVVYLETIGQFNYTSLEGGGGGGELVELPLMDRTHSVYLFVPGHEPYHMKPLGADVSDAFDGGLPLETRIDSMRLKHLRVRLPMLRLHSATSLAPVLRSLGMRAAFNHSLSDLTSSEPIMIACGTHGSWQQSSARYLLDAVQRVHIDLSPDGADRLRTYERGYYWSFFQRVKQSNDDGIDDHDDDDRSGTDSPNGQTPEPTLPDSPHPTSLIIDRPFGLFLRHQPSKQWLIKALINDPTASSLPLNLTTFLAFH